MRIKFFSLLTGLFLIVSTQLKADEGMWLPLLISKNYDEMKKLGIRITAEDIYNVNKSSLKDAVVNFGGFCSGEVISRDGLVLTNHHCGFDAIQAQSSVGNDLLTNGFWAMSKDQELPSPGLTVSFLVRMEDVTNQILPQLSGITDWSLREQKIDQLSDEISQKATEGTGYTAEIKPFYEGNAFYMFIYEVYKDVRMVGAPPSAIGKFGGDTDNWMWPRHTGDFSMFRIYTGPDGKPAEYSKNNIPFKPKFYFPISLKGVKENDYAMVMGYPGSTERYMPAEGVRMTYEESNPARIKIRGERLELMKKDMDASEKVRIMYAGKYAHVSNYYKYFIGQNQGINRLDVIEKKKEQDKDLQNWVNSDPDRSKKYGNILTNYDNIYSDYRNYNLPYIYLEEAAFGTEIIEFSFKASELFGALKGKASAEELKQVVDDFQKEADEFYKNYHPSTDQKVFAALMKLYHDDIDPKYHPEIFKMVDKKYKGNFKKYADYVFRTSIFPSKQKMEAFLKAPNIKVLEKDPGFQATLSIISGFRQTVAPGLRKVYSKLEVNDHDYLEAILEKRANEKLYPDANFTMRITYGSVKSYDPRDAVHYLNHTTLKGVMEKEDSTNEEFIVPTKLKTLFKNKDFGRYAENGEMPVCFITTNDITGGNSGSPVLDADGYLIGTAFDGNWEAMSGDIIFEPQLQRTIATDIRYILFVIDKYAGAGYLLDEMNLIEENPDNKKAELMNTTTPAEAKK